MKNRRFSKTLSKHTSYLLLFATIFVNIFQNIYSQENVNLNTNDPEKTNSSQLLDNKSAPIDADKKDTDNKDDKSTPPNAPRMIVETSIELVENDACECSYVALSSSSFPIYGFFAIGGGAFVPVLINGFDNKPPSAPLNVVSQSSP